MNASALYQMTPATRLFRLFRNVLLPATVGCLLIPIADRQAAKAAADYCHTDATGDYVCIHNVFGSRASRQVIYTVNGRAYSATVNCYLRDYGITSIAAVACWSYSAVSKTKPSTDTKVKPADVTQTKLLLTNGTPSSSNTITPEQVKSKLPPEMK